MFIEVVFPFYSCILHSRLGSYKFDSTSSLFLIQTRSSPLGSIKLKVGDNDGALEAYMTLLQEVKEDSPAASQTEKAKAHIKCATIYRQQDNTDSHVQSIAHLREALTMYTAIYGPEHKDTAAIASSLRQWLSEDRV